MSTETPVIERAFQIAGEGHCADTMAVRVELSRLGYKGAALAEITPAVAMEIKRLCVESRAIELR